MKIYTIRDIAQLAGVSVTTVSRVLNHRPDVNPVTRARVEQVMAEHHFVGNANARGLKQADAELIVMILRGRQNIFLHSLAESILQAASPDLTMIHPVYIDEQDDEFDTALRLFHEQRVCGVIFLGTRIDERARVLDSVDVPMVAVTTSAEGTCLSRAASVSVDDRSMSHAAVKAMLDRGHRRIAVFGGSLEGTDPVFLRYQGAMDAFREAGVPFDPALFQSVRFSVAEGFKAAKAFFPRHPDTTAVFCMSDHVALGVMRALHDLGLSVPGQVSVMGFDGMELGQYTVPRLSTVIQPVDELARQTVSVLRGMLQGDPPAHVIVPAAVALRESVQARA